MPRSARVLLALILGWACVPMAATTRAQESRRAGLRKLETKWEGVVNDWETAKHKVADEVLRRFDAIGSEMAKSSGLTEGARADRRKLLEGARKKFSDEKAFPADERFDEFAYFYGKQMSEAFLRFDRAASAVATEVMKMKDVVLLDTITKTRAEVAEKVGAVGRLTGSSGWQGTFHADGGKNLPYQLNISEVEPGGSFKGHVEENLGVDNNWSYDIEGQNFGAKFEFGLTKATRGPLATVHVVGYVCGDRLFGEVAQATAKGENTRARFILRKVK